MKKAQVTIFIIIAILVVALIATLFYLKSDLIKSIFNIESNKAETVPEQIKPVQQYIENCVSITGEEGASLLGMQGGYISLPKDTLPRSIVNQFSNSLEVVPGFDVTYWYYERSNGIQKSQMPTKKDMETELASYINENLPYCLDNLTQFEDQGYAIDIKNNIDTEVTIQDTHIEINVNYPITVTINDISKEIKNHFADIKVPLGELYTMSSEILTKENQEYFLEEKTIDMMIIYDEIPYSGFSFDCAPKVWFKNDIQKDFKEIVSTNINALKINGLGESEKYFTIDLPKNYQEVSANFIYSPNWPFYLSIDDDKEVLKEETLTNNKETAILATAVCLSNYHFVYDVKYPVLITLNKDDYTFQFATMVLIDNNQARENLLGTNSPEDTDTICNYATTPTRIYAINSETGSTLDGARITFSCVTSTCSMGETYLDSDNTYSLTTNFPPCLNALIKVEKEGFNTASTRIDTNTQTTTSILLQPIYEKKLTIKAIENGRIRDLKTDESALIQLENEIDNYAITVTQNDQKIGLIDGTYLVKAFLIKESSTGFTLKSQEIQYCAEVPKKGVLGLIGLKETKCSETTIEPMTVNSLLIGGAEFVYEIQKEDLKQASEFTVYLIAKNPPTTYEALKSIYETMPSFYEDPSFIFPTLK